MSFSYTPETPRPLDFVRLNIFDTDSNNPKFQDEEIDMILDQTNDPLFACYNLCLTLAAKYNAMPSTKLGDYEVKYTELSNQYQNLAEKFRIRASASKSMPYAGGLTHTDKSTDQEDQDQVQPRFYTQMQEYNKTPNQNKGTW